MAWRLDAAEHGADLDYIACRCSLEYWQKSPARCCSFVAQHLGELDKKLGKLTTLQSFISSFTLSARAWIGVRIRSVPGPLPMTRYVIPSPEVSLNFAD